jgi:hypothetical protein
MTSYWTKKENNKIFDTYWSRCRIVINPIQLSCPRYSGNFFSSTSSDSVVILLAVCYASPVFSFFSSRISGSFYYASYTVDLLISVSSTLISAFPNVQYSAMFSISNSFESSYVVIILFVNYLLRSSSHRCWPSRLSTNLSCPHFFQELLCECVLEWFSLVIYFLSSCTWL